MNITRNLLIAVLMTIVTTLLFGVAYPLVVTGLAQVLFPDKANGQLIERNGKVIGSRIIGQAFSSPGYFRGRPSAAGTGYDPLNSGGTNLGPTNKKLIDAVKAAVDAAKRADADGCEVRGAGCGRHPVCLSSTASVGHAVHHVVHAELVGLIGVRHRAQAAPRPFPEL
jgi:K+-transporting ATPase KdpC subunit